jgi:hypothetical protein
MKSKFLLLSFLIINANKVLAQSLRYSLAQPYVNLSAYSLHQSDPLSFTGNQAALAKVKSSGIGFFSERRFLLSATNAYTLGASLQTRLGNFGLQLNYAGFKNFNENKIGMAYAQKLGKLVDIGVQFNYYGYRIPVYGKASTINFEIGTMVHLTDKLNVGLHVYNPVGGKLGKASEEKLAAVYKFGLGYDASDNFFIGGEIIKEEDKPVNIITGLQYHFDRQFFVKAGFLSESTTAYVGAGVAWKNLRLDISSSYHPQLGFSPGLLVIMSFKSKS